MNGFFKIPNAINETVLDYAPNSKEKLALKQALTEARSQVIDIPMFINGQEVRTGNTQAIFPPHDLHHQIGNFHLGEAKHVHQAMSKTTFDHVNANIKQYPFGRNQFADAQCVVKAVSATANT